MTDSHRAGILAARAAVQEEMRRKLSGFFTPREKHLMSECLEHAIEAIEMLIPHQPPKQPERHYYRGPGEWIGPKAGAGAEHERRSQSAKRSWTRRRAQP